MPPSEKASEMALSRSVPNKWAGIPQIVFDEVVSKYPYLSETSDATHGSIRAYFGLVLGSTLTTIGTSTRPHLF